MLQLWKRQNTLPGIGATKRKKKEEIIEINLKKKKKEEIIETNTHGDTDEVEEIGVQKNGLTLLSLLQKRIPILFFF